jgi:lambda repressor-like predicted transcriptional regulator
MADPKQTALKAKITRLRNASKRAGISLEVKVSLLKQHKEAQEELKQYRLSLAAEKAYQRSLPKLKRLVVKAIDAMAREITREQLRQVCKKPPAEFQAWGHTRTMAWLKLAKEGNGLVKRKRPNLEAMRGVMRSIEQASIMSLETCQKIINPPKK